MLFIFSLLGIYSVINLLKLDPDNYNFPLIISQEVETDVMLAWDDSIGFIKFSVVLIIIGIPSIIFLYKLLKKDFIQLRDKFKK